MREEETTALAYYLQPLKKKQICAWSPELLTQKRGTNDHTAPTEAPITTSKVVLQK